MKGCENMKKETRVKDIDMNLIDTELEKEIDESEEDIKNNKVYEAREVFEEMRQQYGY